MIANMNEISRRLKQFREDQGYNQAGMAKIADMTQRAWAGWEENPPKALLSLAAIAKHFGISADYFLVLIDDKQNYKTTSLPEGGTEVIENMAEMSDRARQELIAISRVIREADQRWEQYERALFMIEQMGGAAELDQLFADYSSTLRQVRLLRLSGVTLTFDSSTGTINIVPQE